MLLLEGAQESMIDQHEFMAKSAMANGYAQRAKKPKEKKIFDADKARQMLTDGMTWGNAKQRMDYDTFKQLKDSLQGFKPQFKKKGGK